MGETLEVKLGPLLKSGKNKEIEHLTGSLRKILASFENTLNNYNSSTIDNYNPTIDEILFQDRNKLLEVVEISGIGNEKYNASFHWDFRSKNILLRISLLNFYGDSNIGSITANLTKGEFSESYRLKSIHGNKGIGFGESFFDPDRGSKQTLDDKTVESLTMEISGKIKKHINELENKKQYSTAENDIPLDPTDQSKEKKQPDYRRTTSKTAAIELPDRVNYHLFIYKGFLIYKNIFNPNLITEEKSIKQAKDPIEKIAEFYAKYSSSISYLEDSKDGCGKEIVGLKKQGKSIEKHMERFQTYTILINLVYKKIEENINKKPTS